MTMKRTLSLLLAVLLLCACAASCGTDVEDMEEFETYLPETVEPIDDTLQTDYTSNADTVAYLDDLKKTFTDLPASPAADFKTVSVDGGVKITDYLGSDIAVRVPDTIDGSVVVAIADAAFADKTDIKKLYIPDSVTSFGTGILKGCSSLTALHTPLPNGENSYLGYLFGAKTYADNARDIPSSLVFLELGGAMTALSDYALFDCNDLRLLTLPDGVRSIGTYALYNCESLLALDADGLTSLDEHALDSCLSLTRLEFGEGLAAMGFGALQGCDGLRRLTLPFVGDGGEENAYLGYVFGASVPDFAKGYYPPYLTEIELLSVCEKLGNYAFFECESLERVTMEEGVSSIGVRAFAGCVRLESVTLPDSLQRIRENSFFGCLSLESVAFGEGSVLDSIGINAFYSCDLLKNVVLPQSLKALPASCFADCVSLQTINLGGVSTVGKNAFHHCTKLTDVTAVSDIVLEEGNEPIARAREGVEE